MHHFSSLSQPPGRSVIHVSTWTGAPSWPVCRVWLALHQHHDGTVGREIRLEIDCNLVLLRGCLAQSAAEKFKHTGHFEALIHGIGLAFGVVNRGMCGPQLSAPRQMPQADMLAAIGLESWSMVVSDAAPEWTNGHMSLGDQGLVPKSLSG